MRSIIHVFGLGSRLRIHLSMGEDGFMCEIPEMVLLKTRFLLPFNIDIDIHDLLVLAFWEAPSMAV